MMNRRSRRMLPGMRFSYLVLPALMFIWPVVTNSRSGNGSYPRGSDLVLIVPARPGILQLAFDLARMRDITFISFRAQSSAVVADKSPEAPPRRGQLNADQPLLHVWTGSDWQYISFDDFCSLRFVEHPPRTAIVIGDDQTVPKALLQGMNWPGKIERWPTMNPADVINGINPYFKFNSREWQQLADSYGLKLKGVDAPPAKQLQQTNAFRQEKGDNAPAVPVVQSAAAFSDNQIPDAVKQKSDNKLHLHLSEDEYISFIWITPLSIWVGQYEATNAQYSRFNRAHDPKRYYDHILNLPDQPAVLVSWEDANNYCGWLNRNFHSQLPPGFECRLPTEKEWTVFAACGREVQYPWGDQWPPPNSFNYKGTEGASIFYGLFHNEQFIRGHDDGFIVTAPVGKSGTNEWGLYGVGGNAWEWCQDWFDDAKTMRVLRGAAWNNYEPAILAVSNRSAALPEKSNAMIGFRVVIAPRKKMQN